MLAFKVVES